jgi:hypothetical protein
MRSSGTNGDVEAKAANVRFIKLDYIVRIAKPTPIIQNSEPTSIILPGAPYLF